MTHQLPSLRYRESDFVVAVSALCVLAVSAASASTHAAYIAKKLVGNLNQATFVTAAPGDDNNLYVVQRAGTNNTVGDIVRYNKTSGLTSS